VGPHGRVDLRGDPTLVAVCVDGARKGLKDDALSWHGPSHTLLVHSTAHLAGAVAAAMGDDRGGGDNDGGGGGDNGGDNNDGAGSATSGTRRAGGTGGGTSGGLLLDLVARRRSEACYLPRGALLLLPPDLLAAASLAAGFVKNPSFLAPAAPDAATVAVSAQEGLPLSSSPPPAAFLPTANECVTVAVRFAGPGHPQGLAPSTVVGVWVFESVIGPVATLSFNMADNMVAAAAAAAGNDDGATYLASAKDPAARTVAHVCRHVDWLEAAVTARQPPPRTKAQHDRAARGGVAASSSSGGGSSGSSGSVSMRAVDLGLSLFSLEARRAIRRAGLVVPSLGPGARRFATAPLRRYADLVAQRQLTAALRGGQGALSRARVAAAVSAAGASRKGTALRTGLHAAAAAAAAAKTAAKTAAAAGAAKTAGTGAASRRGPTDHVGGDDGGDDNDGGDDDSGDDDGGDDDGDGGSSFSVLAAACAAQTTATGRARAVFPGVATGRGREVEIVVDAAPRRPPPPTGEEGEEEGDRGDQDSMLGRGAGQTGGSAVRVLVEVGADGGARGPRASAGLRVGQKVDVSITALDWRRRTLEAALDHEERGARPTW